MAVRQSYLLTDSLSLSANGSGSISFAADANTSYEVYKIYIQSTGAFSITDVRIESNHFIGTGTEKNLKSTTIPKVNGATGAPYVLEFAQPFIIPKNGTLIIDFKDTSGSANTIDAYGVSVRVVE